MISAIADYVKSRRQRGSFRVSDIEGKAITDGITHRKLTLIKRASTLLTERRPAAPPTLA